MSQVLKNRITGILMNMARERDMPTLLPLVDGVAVVLSNDIADPEARGLVTKAHKTYHARRVLLLPFSASAAGIRRAIARALVDLEEEAQHDA